jgi:gamma-tubulin complex component 2
MVEDNKLLSANGQAINEESTFKLIKANIPFLPDWLMKRPNINHNNLVSRPFFDKHVPNNRKKTYEEEPKTLGSFPLEIQETLLIEDLLHSMNSIEGVYIRRENVESEYDDSSKYVYKVESYLESATCDFSLLYLIGKILPMCNNHDKVLEFVSTHSHFEFGQVSQAL